MVIGSLPSKGYWRQRVFSHDFSFAALLKKSLALLKITLSIMGSHRDGVYEFKRVFSFWVFVLLSREHGH